jgi:hypothetical protein
MSSTLTTVVDPIVNPMVNPMVDVTPMVNPTGNPPHPPGGPTQLIPNTTTPITPANLITNLINNLTLPLHSNPAVDPNTTSMADTKDVDTKDVASTTSIASTTTLTTTSTTTVTTTSTTTSTTTALSKPKVVLKVPMVVMSWYPERNCSAEATLGLILPDPDPAFKQQPRLLGLTVAHMFDPPADCVGHIAYTTADGKSLDNTAKPVQFIRIGTVTKCEYNDIADMAWIHIGS